MISSSLNNKINYDTAKPYGPSDVSKLIHVAFVVDLGSSPET